MDSGTSCPCDSTDQSSDPTEYLESLKRKYLDRTAKLQVQQMELEQRIQQMEKFLGADKLQNEDESMSTCSCDLQTVPRVFPETPVRDIARQIIAPTHPPTQQCSFFQKIMDNARSILSIKCQCASAFVSAKSTSITPKEVTTSDSTPSDPPTRENDTADMQTQPEGEITCATESDSKTSTCTCDNSNSSLQEASCSCNLDVKVAQAQQVSINTSNPTPSKTPDSSNDDKKLRAATDDSENKGCSAELNGCCSCEACRCSSSMVVDDKLLQLEADQPVVIPKITLFSSKGEDNPNAEVQATANVESRGLNTQFASNVSSKGVTCCQLPSCPSKRTGKDAGDNSNAERPNASNTQNRIVDSSTQKNTLGVAACCQSRFCPVNTKPEYPVQPHQCRANAAATRGDGRPDGPPGCPGPCGKATYYKASGPDRPNFNDCFEKCETNRQDGQNQCAFVGSPLLNPSDFRIGKPLEDKSAGTHVPDSQGPQKICQNSTFSLTSNDIIEMQNIAELAKKERQMKAQIEALQKRERAYQEVTKDMNTLVNKTAECCSCHTANNSSNIQNEIQKISQELRLENQILKSELMDLKIELKHCLEKVEGPMKQKLQTEKQKCEILQQKLQHASQDMLLNQDTYSREMNQLKLQLCCACANITELNQMNGRLKEEMSQLDCLCAKLEDDLVKQKISEADTIKRLTSRRLSGDGLHNTQFTDENRCDSSLDVIARKLSKTLKELAPCDECTKVPPEVAGAAKCIKELTDMVRKRRMKSSASSGCCCESKSKYSAKDILGDECCTCCSQSVERVDKKDTIKTRTKKASPPFAGAYSPAARAAPSSSAREVSEGEKCDCPSRTARGDGGEPNDPTSRQQDQKTLQTLLSIPESFVQKDASSKFDVNGTAASFYSAQGEPVREKVPSSDRGTVTIRENATITELSGTGIARTDQEESPDDFVLATVDVEQPTLESKSTTMKEVKSTTSDVMTETPPIKLDKACKAPCSRTKMEAGKDTEDEAQPMVESDGVTDIPPTKMDKDCKAPCSTASKKAAKGGNEEFSEKPISESVPDMSEASGEAGTNRAGDGIDFSSGDVTKTKMGRGLPEEGAEGVSESVPDMSDDANGLAADIPSGEHMEDRPFSESEKDTLKDSENTDKTKEDTDTTEDAEKTGDENKTEGIESSTGEPPSAARIGGQEIPFEEIRIGTFPVDVETKAYALDESPDGLHVTTTITGSGNLEIITEGPGGTIETTLTYTNEGNIEVVTEMVEYPEEKSSPVEQALEKYTTEPTSRGRGMPDVSYNLLEEESDQMGGQAVGHMGQPKLKPIFPVASSKFSGPSGPETDTPYTPSSVSGEGELTSNLGSQSSGVKGNVNVTPDLTSGEASVMRDGKGNLLQDGDIITPEGFVLTGLATPAERPMEGALSGDESASKPVQSIGGTQSAPDAIRQDVEGHTDPVTSEAGITSQGVDMPSGEVFTPDQVGSDAEEGHPMSEEAGSKPGTRGPDFDSADVEKTGEESVPDYVASVADGDRTLDEASSPDTSPTGTRKTRDCSCQSKDQKDQSCQCCECKTIGVTTSGDKETTTVEPEEMCKTPQEEPRTDTDSEFVTTSDFTDNAAEQRAGEKISDKNSKEQQQTIASSELKRASKGSSSFEIIADEVAITEHPELIGKSPEEQEQILASMGYVTPKITSILIDQNMLEKHPELAGKSPSEQQRKLKSLGYVAPKTTSALIDQNMLEEHPELADKSPSQQQEILEALGYEVIPTTTSILIDQNMIEKHPELADKSPSQQQEILEALGYEVIPTTTSILIDQNMIEKHPELAGKSSSEQQEILKSLGYVAPKTTSTLVDQNKLEEHPEVIGKSSSEQEKILESLGYEVIPTTTSILVDQDMLDEHPELVDKSPSEQKQILESLGYVVIPSATSILIDQNMIEKHPELAGKSSSEQQEILKSLGYVVPKTTSTKIDQSIIEKHPELAGKSSSEQQEILKSLGYVVPKTTSTKIDQSIIEKHPELAGKSSSEQQEILKSLGYVVPKTTSTKIDQSIIEKHPELAGKSSSEQQEILKSLGYVVPKTTSTKIDQSIIEKHPELAGKSSSEQQEILKSLGYVVPKTTSTKIDQNIIEKHPELAGKSSSEQQEILKSLGYVVPKTTSTVVDQKMIEKHPELVGKRPSEQQQILESLGYIAPETPSTLIDQNLIEKHPELVGKRPSQQQEILKSLGYVTPKISTPIDQSVLEKHPELASKTPSQQKQILENLGYATPKASVVVNEELLNKHPELVGKTSEQQQIILAGLGYKPSSQIIDKPKASPQEYADACKAPCRKGAKIRDDPANMNRQKEGRTLPDASSKTNSKILDSDRLVLYSEPINKSPEQQVLKTELLNKPNSEVDNKNSEIDKSQPSSKEISITCRAPCRSASTIHDNAARFSGSKVTRGDVARADSKSISLQKTPSSRDGSASCQADYKTVSVQRDDEVVKAARNNSSTLSSSSTSNEKIKKKEKIKSKPGEVPSIVSELSDKDRPVIESPKKPRAQRKKRSSRIMDCLKCNCEDPCRCEVCSPDKSGRRQRKVSRPVRSCDCPAPVMMQSMPMASSMPLPSHAGTSTFNPFTGYPQLPPGTMAEGESPTSDENDVKKIKRHSSKCECVDCLCMPKIKMLAETVEYPVVYDRKQIYHVKTSCDTCSDAQKAKKNAETRSRIPISTTTPNPPKPGISKQGRGLPGDDDVVSHSDSIYNSIACDCTDCKCVECPDPNLQAKLSKDVNKKPIEENTDGNPDNSGKAPNEDCVKKSDKDCCCQETCTCVTCTVEELLKKLQEAEKKLADAQRAPDASPPEKSTDTPSSSLPEKSTETPSDHAGDGESCTCPECKTCPRSDLMKKSNEEKPSQTHVDNKPSETGEEEECTCPECVCPGADSREVLENPDSTSPAPLDENIPVSSSEHPEDCDCADCTCPGIEDLTKTGGAEESLPADVPSSREQAGGGDDECNCQICECPGNTSLPPKSSEIHGKLASDTKEGDEAMPECDCKNCVCSPCADPKKSPKLAECDCIDCKCSPCADPNRGKGKATAKGAEDVEKSSHPSDCDCDECRCLEGIEDEKDGIHPSDCDCPECHCPGLTDQATQPTIDKDGTHPPDCNCPECHCPGLTDQATQPTVDKDGTHLPDCNCPECHCPGLTDQGTQPTIDKDETHPSDCDCPECHCPGLTDQATQPSADKAVHPKDCDCDKCKCLDIVDQAVHALGCACADCLCVECATEAAHAPACRCDVCICQPCDYPVTTKSAHARTIDDHPDDCSCIKCVCNVCDGSSKQSEQQPTEAGQGEHGDGCKCVNCICKECLLKLEPLKHEEGCKCAQCTCVECLRTMSMGGTPQARGLTNEDEPEKGDNCTCVNCICIDCRGKGTAEGTPDVMVGGHDGCACTLCQCDPCPEKESDQPCTCPDCTCVECTKKKGMMVQGTGDKETHSPVCDCPVCECPNSPEPKKQASVHGLDNNDKETHSPVCDCPECKCPDPESPTGTDTKPTDIKPTVTQPGSGDECDCAPICACESEPVSVPDNLKKGEENSGCDCSPACTCEESQTADQSAKATRGLPEDQGEPKKPAGDGGATMSLTDPPPFEPLKRIECNCNNCDCIICMSIKGEPIHIGTGTRGPGDDNDNDDKEVPPFEVPVRINCNCERCDCIFCNKEAPLTKEVAAQPSRTGPKMLVEASAQPSKTGPQSQVLVGASAQPSKTGPQSQVLVGASAQPSKTGPQSQVLVGASAQPSKTCAQSQVLVGASAQPSKTGPKSQVQIASAQPSKTGPQSQVLVGASAQPSKTGPQSTAALAGASANPSKIGPHVSALKSTQSSPHHDGCTCPECKCALCSPVIPTKVSEKPNITNDNDALKSDIPFHCDCPTCTCYEGEIKTTTFESAAASPAASAPASAPASVPASAAPSSGVNGARSLGDNNDTSIETVVLPKPTLAAHMVQVHPVPCDCQQCKCEPCADPSKKVYDGIQQGASVKQMDNLALAKSIQAANKENCECKSQIEEIKRTLERIRCACSEAEFRSTQNVGQTMGRAMDNPPDKPFVKQASPFGQTMSGLKMALANLQAKCKAKDRMIEAMTGELQIRGDLAVFDKVLDMSQKPINALDYDQSEDVKSMNRSQPATNVIYGRSMADQGTEPDCIKNVASKGVEVRSRRKKRKEKEGARNIDNADDDCSCSKPQIVQKEEKDCQKLDLTGFEVIDIRRITDDSLIVKWNPPNCKLVTGYDIFVNGTLASKVMSGSRTSAMMHSLDLSKSVQITIYAVSKCGRIEPPAIAIYEIKS